MTYIGRFASSPTGDLHIGSLVAAVGSWLCAHHAGGRWLVRMDDIDPPREVAGSATRILAALADFGLHADGPVLFQSTRHAAYDAAFAHLQVTGQVFSCWCSRSDLESAGGLHLDARCIAPPSTDRLPAWRLRVPDIEIHFNDGLQGRQTTRLREGAGDFVIRRVDGLYSYQFACAVDDAFQGITEVVRGNDLLDSTARQIWLQRCLGLPTPRYLHLPLALDAQGRKWSKSTGDDPLDPSDPMPPLRQALIFLQRPVPDDLHTLHGLLTAALVDFDPAALPHCSGHLSTGNVIKAAIEPTRRARR